MASTDAIIVGGGHNGLVAAAYLAKAGHHVSRKRSIPGSKCPRLPMSAASSTPTSRRTWSCGGGVIGAPGHNAAMAVLEDWSQLKAAG